MAYTRNRLPERMLALVAVRENPLDDDCAAMCPPMIQHHLRIPPLFLFEIVDNYSYVGSPQQNGKCRHLVFDLYQHADMLHDGEFDISVLANTGLTLFQG